MDKFDYLLIGDLHCRKDNLEESERLLNWLERVCREFQVKPIFMGDQQDDHGLGRVEVQNFLIRHFEKIKDLSPVLLVGNHDMNHEGTEHWMMAHSEQATVADSLLHIDGPIYAMPYIKSNDSFVQVVQDAYRQGARIMLCHQEFNGCELENGFFSPNGVDPKLVPNDMLFISGHIHRQQMMKEVEGRGFTIIYVGAPRQRTRSDIGRANFVVLWNPSTGMFRNMQVPCDVCEPFRHLIITPETTGIDSIQDSSHTYVDVYGPKDFIKKVMDQLPSQVKCRTFPEQANVVSNVKESDGIPKAFMNYVLEYANKHSLGNNQVRTIVGQIYDKCPMLKVGNE